MRFVAFALVGAFGFAVQIAAVAILTSAAGWHAVPATAAAVELAILHNFVWHERWTWRDRAPRGDGRMVRRLARFHVANGVVSMTATVALAWMLVPLRGWSAIAANVAGVASTGVLNFFALDWWVFATARRSLSR
jgi:putative flippase GtrA